MQDAHVQYPLTKTMPSTSEAKMGQACLVIIWHCIPFKNLTTCEVLTETVSTLAPDRMPSTSRNPTTTATTSCLQSEATSGFRAMRVITESARAKLRGGGAWVRAHMRGGEGLPSVLKKGYPAPRHSLPPPKCKLLSEWNSLWEIISVGSVVICLAYLEAHRSILFKRNISILFQ